MQEIERKFLVESSAFKEESERHKRIVQGYLNSHPERTVRVRINGDKAWLTIKGKSSNSGMTRFEFEKEITIGEASSLLKLCEPGTIEKVRYEVRSGSHLFEVDEFLGENEGLVLAEVELQSENEQFEQPEWLGREVTGNIKYYNSQLIRNPYKNWNN